MISLINNLALAVLGHLVAPVLDLAQSVVEAVCPSILLLLVPGLLRDSSVKFASIIATARTRQSSHLATLASPSASICDSSLPSSPSSSSLSSLDYGNNTPDYSSDSDVESVASLQLVSSAAKQDPELEVAVDSSNTSSDFKTSSTTSTSCPSSPASSVHSVDLPAIVEDFALSAVGTKKTSIVVVEEVKSKKELAAVVQEAVELVVELVASPSAAHARAIVIAEAREAHIRHFAPWIGLALIAEEGEKETDATVVGVPITAQPAIINTQTPRIVRTHTKSLSSLTIEDLFATTSGPAISTSDLITSLSLATVFFRIWHGPTNFNALDLITDIPPLSFCLSVPSGQKFAGLDLARPLVRDVSFQALFDEPTFVDSRTLKELHSIEYDPAVAVRGRVVGSLRR